MGISSETLFTGLRGRVVQRAGSGCRHEVASLALPDGHQRSLRDRTEGAPVATFVTAAPAATS